MTKADAIWNKKYEKQIGSNFLIAVGINQYPAEHGCLDNCVSDAQRVYATFKNKAYLSMLPSSLLITSDHSGSTCKQAITKTLDALKGKLQEKQNVVFYYSGHGCILENKFHFTVSDSDFRADTMISIDTLLEALDSLYSSTRGNITVLIDACCKESGQTKGLSEQSRNYRVDYLSRAKGCGIIYACSKGEEALDRFIKEPISVFTSFLLEALEGQAKALDGNYLTFVSLFNYLQESSHLASMQNSQIKQHPTYRFEGTNIVYALLENHEIVYARPDHKILTFQNEIISCREEFFNRCYLVNLGLDYTYEPLSIFDSFDIAREICWELDTKIGLPHGWSTTLATLEFYSTQVDGKKEISISRTEQKETLTNIKKFIESIIMPGL